jgi:uncharacterized Zn-binding protein involved in type VI secretion
MSEAVRVGDLTAHGVPLQGSGSPDVSIGGQKAWRAMPEGAGDGLDEASNDTKAIMDVKPTPATAFAPPSVIPKAVKIETTMMKVAAQVEKALGRPGASAGVTAGFATLKTTTITLTAAYTAAAAVPGGEPGARVAFTMGYQQALSAAMGAAVSSLAGDWDMHSCPQATPAAHGPGFVIKACKTIFINKRPAVVKGHKVVEAAGGSAPVNIGCGTVFFGDKAPGSSGSGSSSNQESQKTQGSGPASGSAGQKQNASSKGTGSSATKPTNSSGTEEKEPVSLEFEVLDDEGLPRKGAVVCLLNGECVVATKTVPASGIVVFENLNDGDEYTVQVDDDPEGFHV